VETHYEINADNSIHILADEYRVLYHNQGFSILVSRIHFHDDPDRVAYLSDPL
jgi:hypothetical protein